VKRSECFDESVEKVIDIATELLAEFFSDCDDVPVFVVEDFGEPGQLGRTSDGTIYINEWCVPTEYLRPAIAHELVHWYLQKMHGDEVAHHGEMFQILADQINAAEGCQLVTEFADDIELATASASVKVGKFRKAPYDEGTEANHSVPRSKAVGPDGKEHLGYLVGSLFYKYHAGRWLVADVVEEK
jgi:hypothetical protein